MKYFDFNKDDIKEHDDLLTKYNNKDLLLKNVCFYDGIITMQYLPYGGIMSVYNYNIIITTKNGFIFCNEVIYDNKKMTSKEFILNNKNLINVVLPN